MLSNLVLVFRYSNTYLTEVHMASATQLYWMM